MGANCAGGGLVGYNDGSITNCYATGDVVIEGGSGQAVGGLVGNSSGSVANCYSRGNVICSFRALISCVGGFIGYNSGSIKNCCVIGNVSILINEFLPSTTINANGLVGYNDQGILSNNYRCDSQIVSLTYDGVVTCYSVTDAVGVHILEFKFPYFYSSSLGWSEDVWAFSNGGYPSLKNVGIVN